MKIETIEEFKARGGEIQYLPPAPAMGDIPLQYERWPHRTAAGQHIEWARLYASGVSIFEIAHSYGITAKHVRKVLLKGENHDVH